MRAQVAGELCCFPQAGLGGEAVWSVLGTFLDAIIWGGVVVSGHRDEHQVAEAGGLHGPEHFKEFTVVYRGFEEIVFEEEEEVGGVEVCKGVGGYFGPGEFPAVLFLDAGADDIESGEGEGFCFGGEDDGAGVFGPVAFEEGEERFPAVVVGIGGGDVDGEVVDSHSVKLAKIFGLGVSGWRGGMCICLMERG